MSLKAKLEAVIYAAEEPVTLTQLASLFAAEAVEWKAEQAANAQTPEIPYSGGESAETLTLLPGEPGDDAAEPSVSESALVEPAPDSAEPTPNPFASADETLSPESVAESMPGAGSEAVTDPPADPEFESKRLARLRDREVRAILRQLLDELIASYAAGNRGVEIREIAGGYRMATKPECHDAVRLFVKSLKPPLKLSLPALETLAVIAYKQPVTAPEVNEIRGVDSSGVFGSLLARKLIATAGRKQVIGRPILYKTTREFLLRFGLKDVAELPSMEEFEKMAAIELDEPESAAGETVEHQTASNQGTDLSLELDDEDLDETDEDDSTDALFDASLETSQTAETAASHEAPTPVEAAPAAPPHTEQAETETLPNAEKDSAEENRIEESHAEKDSAEESREDQ